MTGAESPGGLLGLSALVDRLVRIRRWEVTGTSHYLQAVVSLRSSDSPCWLFLLVIIWAHGLVCTWSWETVGSVLFKAWAQFHRQRLALCILTNKRFGCIAAWTWRSHIAACGFWSLLLMTETKFRSSVLNRLRFLFVNVWCWYKLCFLLIEDALPTIISKLCEEIFLVNRNWIITARPWLILRLGKGSTL